MLQVMRSTPPTPSWERAFPTIVIPMVGRTTGTSDLLDIALEAAQTVIPFSHCTPLVGQLARVGLAMQAIVRNDALAGNEHYLATSAIREMGMVPLTVDRMLGLLSHLMSNWEKAAEHYEDALTLCRDAGFRPEQARTCCDYADTLLQRNAPGDREKAASLLDEALAISSELGMRPLMERVLSRREILKA